MDFQTYVSNLDIVWLYLAIVALVMIAVSVTYLWRKIAIATLASMLAIVVMQHAVHVLTGYPRSSTADTVLSMLADRSTPRYVIFETAFFEHPTSIYVITRTFDIETQLIDSPIMYRVPWDDRLAEMLQRANEMRQQGIPVAIEQESAEDSDQQGNQQQTQGGQSQSDGENTGQATTTTTTSPDLTRETLQQGGYIIIEIPGKVR